ncbi:MAG: N-acetylmuramidase domain-containing protein [Pseudomonadota bacterium]
MVLPDRVPLSEYLRAAEQLRCDPVLVRAHCMKETGDENPAWKRFERHYWRRYRLASRAARRFDRAGNPRGLQARLGQFRAMDRVCQADGLINPTADAAAILSHSHGWPQIMGVHHLALGWESARGFLEAMDGNVEAQTDAYVAFIQADRRLLRAMRASDFETLARIYNGPRHARNRYVPRLISHMAAIRREGHSEFA